MESVRWFTELSLADLADVGGKNSSLGEMTRELGEVGVKVPNGFATTADAFRSFLSHNELDAGIRAIIDGLDVDDITALSQAGGEIRERIRAGTLPPDLESAIRTAYGSLGEDDPAVAVRSSATAEDLPEASFAGQQDTFLNVRGVDNVLARTRDVFASMYTDRAISYRAHHGFDHGEVAVSAGVQRMVDASSGASGVMFTIDTETGFDQVVFITASYGLGELVVGGVVNPDEFYVYKPALAAGRSPIIKRQLGAKQQRMVYADEARTTSEPVSAADRARFCISDEDAIKLAELAAKIEAHYGKPMDIEWAKDGTTGELLILQARPETVQSRRGQVLERFTISDTPEPLVVGRSVGQRIGSGPARVIKQLSELHRVQAGDVLVADMTDPDWEPVMKRASALVTNRGGRTCHAAIIARELGIPAVVGTGDATRTVPDGEVVTVSCAEGDNGYIYPGDVPYDVHRVSLESMPPIDIKIMMNVASPERAFQFASLPNAGVGLARVEFVINNVIGIHPRALLELDQQAPEVREQIEARIEGYPDAATFFEEKLKEGVATIGAAFHPHPVIVRLSDFKSNEYAHLIGGERYEPIEQNPMIGFRGAARYRSPAFADAFALECRAIKRAREDVGLENIEVMIPFVRTLGEADEVLEILADNGLARGENGLRIIMMCEVPSNAIMAEEFLERFDGFSIGSNDLTQFTLALDRDSGLVASLFSERDPAVRALISRAVAAAKAQGKYIGICGQGPSDDLEFARWLAEIGLDSLSLNPDAVVPTWLQLANHP